MHRGRIVWRELATANPAASLAFYTALLGWSSRTAPTHGDDFSALAIDERAVVGIQPLEAGRTSHWMWFAAVDSLEVALAAVRQHQGHVAAAPTQIPGVGEIAIAVDPHGAAFGMMQTDAAVVGSTPFIADERRALSPIAAFYTAVLGWSVDARGAATAPDGTPLTSAVADPLAQRAHWQPVIAVADLPAIEAQMLALGGVVVERKAHRVVFRDPFGATAVLVD